MKRFIEWLDRVLIKIWYPLSITHFRYLAGERRKKELIAKINEAPRIPETVMKEMEKPIIKTKVTYPRNRTRKRKR